MSLIKPNFAWAKRLTRSGLKASVSTSWLSIAPASESSPTWIQKGRFRFPNVLVEDPSPAKLLVELSIQGKVRSNALNLSSASSPHALECEPEADDQPGSQRPGEAPGTSSSSRTAQGRRWQPRPPHGGPHNVALAGCDVSYQSDFVRVDTLPVVDMWNPEEDHIWGALDEGCNSTCQR